MKRLRHMVWGTFGRGFNRLAQICLRRRAKLCPGPCFFCYLILNGERIAKQAVDDAIRVERGQQPVDRRPS